MNNDKNIIEELAVYKRETNSNNVVRKYVSIIVFILLGVLAAYFGLTTEGQLRTMILIGLLGVLAIGLLYLLFHYTYRFEMSTTEKRDLKLLEYLLFNRDDIPELHKDNIQAILNRGHFDMPFDALYSRICERLNKFLSEKRNIKDFELRLGNIKCNFIAYSPELVEENLFCIVQYSSKKLTTYAQIMKVDLTMNEIVISYVINDSLKGLHSYDLTTGKRHDTSQIIKVEHKHNHNHS